jgi:RNA polymerase sigma factor (sigma-70 family)
VTIFREQPALLRRFRSGERAALALVYWRYVDAVAAVIRRSGLLSQHNPLSHAEELSDLVQETFARAFSGPARAAYDGTRDYRPYLLRICRNLLADVARRSGREIRGVDGDELPGPPTAPAWAEAEQLAMVRDYVAALPPVLRAVYEQRYVLGLSQEQAAAALGVGRQTVRTREEKLRKGLARHLQGRETGALVPRLVRLRQT